MTRLTRGHIARIAAEDAPTPSVPREDEPKAVEPSAEDSNERGESVKAYLEETVSKTLHDGMMRLANERPSAPLKFLGEYLLEKSRERGE